MILGTAAKGLLMTLNVKHVYANTMESNFQQRKRMSLVLDLEMQTFWKTKDL